MAKYLDLTGLSYYSSKLKKDLSKGSSYIFVGGNGTPQENALELQAAYNEAKTMSPSSGNIITVVVSPGQYNFTGLAPNNFMITDSYIDVVSLTGNADVHIIAPFSPSIEVYGSNIFVRGLYADKGFSVTGSNNHIHTCTGGTGAFSNTVSQFVENNIYENCISHTGIDSFNGNFKDCLFKDCTSVSNSDNYMVLGSFNSSNDNSVYIRCKSDYNGFRTKSGGSGTGSTVTFIDCEGKDYSFGPLDGDYQIYGSFYRNCKSGGSSFTQGANSEHYNCVAAGDYSFECAGGVSEGVYVSCKADMYSFGSYYANGTYTDCTASHGSFGGNDSGLSAGVFTRCVGGNGSFMLLSGPLYNCVGGVGCFDYLNPSARLYYCRLTSGSFPTPTSGGKIVACIDGNDEFIMIN